MERILIIDDDEPFRRMLREALELVGYEVVEAQDGLDGMKRFKKAAVSLVITDILMPEKEGLETILDLRKEAPEVKIIAVSGGPAKYEYFDVLGLAKNVGATRTFKKPFPLHDFLEVVHQLLRG